MEFNERKAAHFIEETIKNHRPSVIHNESSENLTRIATQRLADLQEEDDDGVTDLDRELADVVSSLAKLKASLLETKLVVGCEYEVGPHPSLASDMGLSPRIAGKRSGEDRDQLESVAEKESDNSGGSVKKLKSDATSADEHLAPTPVLPPTVQRHVSWPEDKLLEGKPPTSTEKSLLSYSTPSSLTANSPRSVGRVPSHAVGRKMTSASGLSFGGKASFKETTLNVLFQRPDGTPQPVTLETVPLGILFCQDTPQLQVKRVKYCGPVGRAGVRQDWKVMSVNGHDISDKGCEYGFRLLQQASRRLPHQEF